MYNGDFNDDIWDEYQWEAHLNEVERKNTQLRNFIIPNHPNNIPRWLKLLQESSDEFDAVDAFIEEELLIDEAYFPSEDDEEIDDDDEGEEEWDDFLFDESKDDYDDYDAGEEWKELSENFAMSNTGSIDTLYVYDRSRSLSASILQWVESINPKNMTANLNDFVGNVLKIGAKIAGGYSFGFDHEFLGGNIAYTKNALYCANDALITLQRDLKGCSYINKKQYYHFHEQLFMLRNDIGIYIQELREQFYNGI